MKIVIASPHRGDAALSLGLSIDAWLTTGRRVQVLNCFTQSEHAPFSDVGSLHPNDRVSFASAIRKREDETWNRLLGGRLHFTDLDLLDAPLRLACGLDEVGTVEVRAGDRAVTRVAGAIAKLAKIAASQSPGSLAIVLPLAAGGHIDHRVTRQAGLDALSAGASLGSLPIPLAFYEDLPFAAPSDSSAGGDAEIELRRQELEALGLDLHPVFAAASAPELAKAVARKRRLADIYDSQIDSEVANRLAEFCARYQGRERLWANAAWRDAEDVRV